MISVRPSRISVRPVKVPSVRGRAIIAHSKPTDDQVKTAIKEAEEACADNKSSKECAAAWDEVEELSAAVSHAQKGPDDPLEKYCEEAPDADECRVYED